MNSDRIRWDQIRSVEIKWMVLIRSDEIGSDKMRLDLIGSDEIIWDQTRLYEVKSDRIGWGEIIWDQMRSDQMISDEIRWPQMTDEISGDRMGSDQIG